MWIMATITINREEDSEESWLVQLLLLLLLLLRMACKPQSLIPINSRMECLLQIIKLRIVLLCLPNPIIVSVAEIGKRGIQESMRSHLQSAHPPLLSQQLFHWWSFLHNGGYQKASSWSERKEVEAQMALSCFSVALTLSAPSPPSSLIHLSLSLRYLSDHASSHEKIHPSQSSRWHHGHSRRNESSS